MQACHGESFSVALAASLGALVGTVQAGISCTQSSTEGAWAIVVIGAL